jgi:hypothetical protein
MSNKLKLWTGLGLGATLVASAAIAAPHGSHKMLNAPHAKHFLLADSGEGGGEGEGGESSAGNDDVTFSTLLGLVEGHIRVGTALYRTGEADMAKTHMKHPSDEIYGDLKPLLDARGSKGFAPELEAVAVAVEAGKPAAEVDALAEALFAAIAATRPVKEAAPAAEVIKNLIRTAGEEYALGVKDGKLDNVHEYQDAWGFTQTAKAVLANLSTEEKAEHAGNIAKIEAELASLDALWPDLAGKTPVSGKAEVLFAAAAKIELAGLAMK